MKLGFRQVSTTTSAMKIRKMKYSLINPLIFFCFISLFSLYFNRGGQCHDTFLRERIALYLTGEITLAHYHDAVADTHQLGNLGRDHDNGLALLYQLAEQQVNIALGADIDAAGRLIEDDDIRVV